MGPVGITVISLLPRAFNQQGFFNIKLPCWSLIPSERPSKARGEAGLLDAGDRSRGMMLPGVELARRRRLHHRNDSYLRGPSELSSAAQPQPIDQPAAAAARRRLEEKLRRPFAGSRSPSSSPSSPSPFPRWMRTSTSNLQDNSRQVHASHESSEVLSLRNSGTGKRSGEHARRSSRTDICAVCLDSFRVQQQVTWLPCAHRYHSSCVLPWLADHSHCPYCRTEVPALDLLSDSVL